MTIVSIGRDFVEISGHAKKAVVCHGVSAISNMVANYASDHDWGKIQAEDGYLKIYDIKERYIGSDLFKAMIRALKDIRDEYPGIIEIKYC